jgi:hypothetical protein
VQLSPTWFGSPHSIASTAGQQQQQHFKRAATTAAVPGQVICSATRLAKRKCPITGQKIQVRVPVWNWVVANVSLMAVGSRCARGLVCGEQ